MGYLLPSMHQTFKFNADATEVSIAAFNKVDITHLECNRSHQIIQMEIFASLHSPPNALPPSRNQRKLKKNIKLEKQNLLGNSCQQNLHGIL